ncbi:Nsp1-like region [Necator americanus]|uniref:Nsp1-like region n=1 Tax=Necator americanus TaxID=51031 RepID=W2TXE4_NECAM|nr:Nsp1-like region [Necator americanus]ETN85702.1 Nsp1-like region [Necator americanus]
MFGFSAAATSTPATTTTSAGITTTPLFSTPATTAASSTTSQVPLTFGGHAAYYICVIFSAAPLNVPLTATGGAGTATDAPSADPASKLSLKGLLEKEGSVGSACSQLLAALTADTEISFADLSAIYRISLLQITQKMTMDLAADERSFLNCLLELNAYDRQLWENMQRITDVESKLVTLEKKQDKMMYDISSISEEQKALDAVVSALEKDLGLPDWTDQNHCLPVDGLSATPGDVKRQQLLQLLVSVDSQIKEADSDLQEIIDQISAIHKSKTAISNSRKYTEDQVAQILKSQMETLIYIDKKTGELDARVDEFKDVLDGRNATLITL